MEIKYAIEIFEKLLKHYEKIDLERPALLYLISMNVQYGLCHCAVLQFGADICCLFSPGGHYKNFVREDGFLFKTPIMVARYGSGLFSKEGKSTILKRIEFLKTEIPYLRNLLKKGYTEI